MISDTRRMEREDARLWRLAVIREAQPLTTYPTNRDPTSARVALAFVGRLVGLRGTGLIGEYREFFALDPERTRALVAQQRDVERRQRLEFLAGLKPSDGGQ